MASLGYFKKGSKTIPNTEDNSGGGGGAAYKIDVNMTATASSGTISNYNLNGATPCEIEQALTADSSTEIVLCININTYYPVIVKPQFSFRESESFGFIYMRALFSTENTSEGEVFNFDITFKLRPTSLMITKLARTAL